MAIPGLAIVRTNYSPRKNTLMTSVVQFNREVAEKEILELGMIIQKNKYEADQEIKRLERELLMQEIKINQKDNIIESLYQENKEKLIELGNLKES